MRFKHWSVLPSLLFFFSSSLFAQVDVAPSLEMPFPGADEIHQLFIHDSIKQIKKVEYMDSCEPIDFEFLDDAELLLIKNWDGKSAIRVMFGPAGGRELIRSRCYIDEFTPL